MDNEWVVVPDDGYVDFNEGCDERHVFFCERNYDSRSVLDMDYLSSKTFGASRNLHPRVPKQVFHIPIQLGSGIRMVPDEGLVEENTRDHVGATLSPSPTTTEKIKGGVVLEADHETVSQFLSKIKEIESPKTREIESPKFIDRVLFPQSDIGALKFEDKGSETQEIVISPRMKIEKEMTIMDCEKVEDCSGGFNFWKWSLNGVGAICSFGFAAATICVLFIGSQQRNNIQEDQKIRFQIYTGDKRIKQVVQHATKLNEAISAVSGVGIPLSRARITCGGYYDGL
ncbi:hypothetical protein VNO78_16959 [Psophocarpus tetragonolobus]|uniref:DUF6821 domain-containing protein n=1 Tax=Psophocarpus tetragonolobus TaxID=3891 RepID=A0AAN9SII1_PSOTE